MYKLVRDWTIKDREEICAVIRLEDNAIFPLDIENRDYRIYLKWLDKGNIPLPADVPYTGGR